MTDDTDDDGKERHVAIRVALDKHRAGMYDELVEAFGKEYVRDLLSQNLSTEANRLVAEMYDSREQISNALEAARDADSDDGDE